MARLISRRALPVDERLQIGHCSIMRNGGTRIVEGFPHRGAKQSMMGFGIGSEAGRQTFLCGNASQEDAHGI